MRRSACLTGSRSTGSPPPNRPRDGLCFSGHPSEVGRSQKGIYIIIIWSMITSSLLSCPNGLQIPVGDGGAWPPVPSEAASQGFHLMVDYWDSCTYLSDWSSIFCVDVDNVSVGLIVSASGLSPWDDPSAMADSSSLLGFLNCRDIFFFCTYFWSENDDRACNSLMKWVWLDGCWWCAWVPFFANLIRKYGEICDFEWETSLFYLINTKISVFDQRMMIEHVILWWNGFDLMVAGDAH